MTRPAARRGWGHKSRGWRSGQDWRGRAERPGGGRRLAADGAGYERGPGESGETRPRRRWR